MRLLHREKHEADTSDHADETRTTNGAQGLSTTDRVERDHTAVQPAPPPRAHTETVERDTPVDRDTTVRERTWTFAPGQVVSLAAGVGLVVVGAIALLRAGVGEPLASPTVEVLTYSHTAWLGLAEIGLGALLVLAGTGAWGRPLSVLLGAATVSAGILVLVEPGQMPEELGLEKSYGWPLVILGAVVALAAMTLPVWRRRTLTDDEIVDLREERRDRDHRVGARV
ncbi:MAG: hypothetical protein ACRDYW_10955 [Acidimicrobiales bacterium]